eukprot:gene2719-12592_t
MSRQTAGLGSKYDKVREMEDRLRNMSKATQEDKSFGHIAQWQAKSDAKVKSMVIQKRLEVLKARRDADLDARRRRLAEKLQHEDWAMKEELINSQETPEECRAKLASRARALASKREAERLDQSATLRERAFQENCNVLRETNSKRALFRTLDERTAQIEQKMAAKIAEEEEKRMFHEMNENERMKKEQRYTDEQHSQRERRDATVRSLDEQVRGVNQRREEEAAGRLQEIEELKALWDAMAREQEAEEAAERERMQHLAADLFEFNKIKQMELTDRERSERELDLRILQDALAREGKEEEREAAMRRKRQEDIRHYREQLASLMEIEADETAERDALIQAVFDQQQTKRDAELAAREEARRQLMAEVDAIRQEQIAYKNGQRTARLDELEFERMQLAEDALTMSAEDARRKKEYAKKALLTKLEIQTQMVSKAHIKAAEHDERLRSLEHAQGAEKMYATQVKQTLEANEPKAWHGRRKFDFYT